MSTISTTITSTVTLATTGSYASPLTVAATGAVEGSFQGIYGPISQAWTVVNHGTIEGTGAPGFGVYLRDGGSVANSSSAALISGSGSGLGIVVDGAAGTVSNAGTIEVTAGLAGVIALNDGGSVANTGTAALISGYNGVYIGNAAGTVTNAGTISGGTDAVIFNGAFNDRVIVDPGAVFVGNVGGGSGGNTLELASAAATGTLSGGIGSKYQNFTTVVVDANARWALSGNDTTTPITLNSGAYLDNSGTIKVPSAGIYGAPGGAVSVSNAGTIDAGTYSSSVFLTDGGSVANTGTAALIVGGHYGVIIDGAAGAISNAGTIEATGTGGTGVDLGGGSIANTGTAALISGVYGVFIYGAAGTVTNAGTIESTATSSTGVFPNPNLVGVGLYLAQGGTATNAGTIIGAIGRDAVLFGSGSSDRMIVDPGAVFVGNVYGGTGSNTLELASAATTGTISGLGSKYQNFGTVTVDAGAHWVLANSNTIASGATLSDFGTLSNTGTLSGAGELVVDPGSMSNSGSVGITVTLDGGSYLDNTGSGLITVAGTAVYGTANGADSVGNAGTIEGTGTIGDGVFLRDGGSVANTGTAALIEGYSLGIAVGGAAGTVTNTGTIEGGTGNNDYGVYLKAGGTVANSGAAALIKASFAGVKIASAAGTVSNAGTIEGSFYVGVRLLAGGSVANTGTAALISGSLKGVFINGAAGTVSNAGTIQGVSDDAVILFAGGSVANTGAAALISGQYGVVIVGGAGTVSNAGTIEGTGTVGAEPTDLIGAGLYLAGGGTVTNAGTIAGASGHDAVYFHGTYTGRVIVDPGAVFVGNVIGGSGSNTLELASAATTGTISGLGSKYQNFGTVIVDPNASWALAGANTAAAVQIASGATLAVMAGASLAGQVVFLGGGGTVKLDGSLASDPNPALAAASTASDRAR